MSTIYFTIIVNGLVYCNIIPDYEMAEQIYNQYAAKYILKKGDYIQLRDSDGKVLKESDTLLQR